MAVLSAERIKITTTKSPLWCTIIIIVLGWDSLPFSD